MSDKKIIRIGSKTGDRFEIREVGVNGVTSIEKFDRYLQSGCKTEFVIRSDHEFEIWSEKIVDLVAWEK